MIRTQREVIMRLVTSRMAARMGPAAVLGALGIALLTAQQAPAVKRNIVFKQDMTIPGREAVMAWVELPPGSAEVRHTHPAEVYGFVEEGTITLDVEGQPTKSLKAGDVFYIPPGKIHQGFNKSGGTAKLSAVFIAEKGKPLTTEVQ
jgi:quercetin dioxygenase-like cupin family protein